jgi:hypothetical protein
MKAIADQIIFFEFIFFFGNATKANHAFSLDELFGLSVARSSIPRFDRSVYFSQSRPGCAAGVVA